MAAHGPYAARDRDGGKHLSVSSLLTDPEVCGLIDRLLPDVPRKVNSPVLAEPRTRAYGTVGTAFDYALRFELQRRHPSATAGPWVASLGLEVLALLTQDATILRAAATLMQRARAEVVEYLSTSLPTAAQTRGMAGHAIRLAKLDVAYRASYVDAGMDTASPEDVEDILTMLGLVPYEAFTGNLVLNPTFGRFSRLVGGADADIIHDGTLLDIKAIKGGIEKTHVRQLVSYAILADALAKEEGTPRLEKAGIYLGRHARFWTFSLAPLYGHPEYASISEAYLTRATRAFALEPTMLDVARQVAKGAAPGTGRPKRRGLG